MRTRKQVTLAYFAVFREYRQTDGESVSTAARDAGELYQELKLRHGLPLPATSLRVAINGEFAPWNRELEDGDTVTFIAPVAGG